MFVGNSYLAVDDREDGTASDDHSKPESVESVDGKRLLLDVAWLS
jgi:hypothetical protein